MSQAASGKPRFAVIWSQPGVQPQSTIAKSCLTAELMTQQSHTAKMVSLVCINRQIFSSPSGVWPSMNATMPQWEQDMGRDRNAISWANVPHPNLVLTAWPQPPRANRAFWPVFLSVSAGLTQARHSKSECNYWDNYHCDLVRPGFVFKWTHLPWALERRLLRTDWVLCHSFSLLRYPCVCLCVLNSRTHAHSAFL